MTIAERDLVDALRAVPHLMSVREAREIVAGQVALLGAQLLLWTRPVGRLVTPMSRHAVDSPRPRGHERIEAMRVARGIQRAAHYGVFRPNCLVRALALHRSLEGRGIRGSCVRIGVRYSRGEFAAHAWVEHAGAVLGDTAANAGTFTTLTDTRLVSLAFRKP